MGSALCHSQLIKSCGLFEVIIGGSRCPLEVWGSEALHPCNSLSHAAAGGNASSDGRATFWENIPEEQHVDTPLLHPCFPRFLPGAGGDTLDGSYCLHLPSRPDLLVSASAWETFAHSSRRAWFLLSDLLLSSPLLLPNLLGLLPFSAD